MNCSLFLCLCYFPFFSILIVPKSHHLWQSEKQRFIKSDILTTANLPNQVMQTLPIVDTSNTTSSQPTFDTTIKRRKTRPVKVGNVTIGGGYPVVVQSMINEDTLDIDGSVAGIRRLHEIGCEIVRVTVPSMAHAKALAEIKQKIR